MGLTDYLKENLKRVKAISLYSYGPYNDSTREDIPDKKGIYFGFEIDKHSAEQGKLVFKRLAYVGKATKDNTLKKRIGDHYTQNDLINRLTGMPLDMSSIVFFICVMDKSTDDEISDVEAAEIYAHKPIANKDGVEHYIGKVSPMMVFMTNAFKLVDNHLYKKLVIVTSYDK